MNILKIGGKVIEASTMFRMSSTRTIGCYISTCYYVERADGFKYNIVHCMSVYSRHFADRWWIKPLTK